MRFDQMLRRAGIVLSLIGLLVALYLVYIKFDPASTLCLASGGCEKVNTSMYSEVRGIPVAALGALAYVILLGIFLFETRFALLEEYGPVVAFGLALAGVLYSAYLTYLEVVVIKSICPYCVTSAVVMTLILVVTTLRLRRYLNAPEPE